MALLLRARTVGVLGCFLVCSWRENGPLLEKYAYPLGTTNTIGIIALVKSTP